MRNSKIILIVSTIYIALFLSACARSTYHEVGPNLPYTGVKGIGEIGDFISTARRADVVSNDEFVFKFTFFESDYKKYLIEPFISVFKIYIKHSPTRQGANITIAMCSDTEICVFNSGGGSISNELFRTVFSVTDGSLAFTIPSELIPKNTEMPRQGILVWSHSSIDNSLWRVVLSNSRNSVQIPTWQKSRFPPKYIRYRNFLELI